ncbi:hypothetical protein GYMLUDRAFT_252970 [Collybiopsis luxurians FD-317 M1]|uniref:Uncharacterized protein n=1 Tax=Collybiopsis luxurians FD-317 M1 TaxID=944289 RepID=A0A0D0B8M0_9AGAR|nr:hypothetical protein GYMLUDRAFT_252970 [Collybiopsis luxurians FD-317 M1]
MSTVWFMVDATDPRLNYSGSWTPITNTNNISANSFDQSSFTGPAFNSTLHATKENATISLRFNGSSYLGVYGSQDGVLNTKEPDVNCLLDGAATWTFGDRLVSGQTDNNVLACRADSRIGGSSPGEHTLIINVTNYPGSSSWFFDYITFESLADPTVDGETLQAGNAELIDASNYSMLTFGSGWSLNPDDSSVTKLPGSSATMKFNDTWTMLSQYLPGTSLSLYGGLLNNISNTAAYRVDDQDPIVIQLPGGIGSTTRSKQVLFTASNLSIGEHTVQVAFNGSQSGMPLDIDYFYVTSLTAAQRASINSSSAAPSPIGNSSSLPDANVSGGHRNRGIIIGAVLGSVIPTLLLIGGVTLWFRVRVARRRKALFAAAALEIGLEVNESSTESLFHGFQDKLVVSRRRNSSTEKSDVNNNNRARPASTNAVTLKLEQRLAVMQDEIQRRDRQLAEGSTQQSRAITVHTDSGWRLPGTGLDGEAIEVPPGYTAN